MNATEDRNQSVRRERRPTEELLAAADQLRNVQCRLATLAGLASAWGGTRRVSAVAAAVQATRDELLAILADAEAWRRSLPPRAAKPTRPAHLTGRDPADEL